jgi:hypothetical protein
MQFLIPEMHIETSLIENVLETAKLEHVRALAFVFQPAGVVISSDTFSE